MTTTAVRELDLRPIEVQVKDPGGADISGAHVRATYAYSGLTSGSTTGEDGIASVPLSYCATEPMKVEAVAPGYYAETVNEYRPDREHFKLGLTLIPLVSEWEQATVPLRASNGRGSISHPIVGQLQIAGTQFQITNQGDVSINGCVSTWHGMAIGMDYNILMPNGTELTIRFLEIQPGFSATFEHSPPKQHHCAL